MTYLDSLLDTLTPDSILSWAQPAVIVDPMGDVVSINAQAQVLWQQLQKKPEFWFPFLAQQRRFKYYMGEGWLVEGTPTPIPGAFLLAWKQLSEPELRLFLFQAVAKAVNSSLIFEEIFDALGEVLQTFLPFTSGTIVILDESQNTTKVVVNLDENGFATIRGDKNQFSGYDSAIHELIRTPQAQLLTQPFKPSVLLDAQAPMVLLAPLVNKGMVIGCISLSGTEYTDAHLQLVEEVSEQLAIAIENARLYWQTQAQAGREFLINQITKAIRNSLDIGQILDTTAQEVGKVLGLNRCIIHYWGGLADNLRHYQYNLPGTSAVGDLDGLAQCQQTVFLSRQSSEGQFNPFVLNDSRSYQAIQGQLDSENIKSLASFPILLDQDFVGTISLQQCDTYRAWLQEEIELLQAIAEHVSVALKQAKLFEETENQKEALEKALQELQQAQMHLVQNEKMAVLGQFVAGIAHEVNTPLGALMANNETVSHCLDQIQTEQQKFKLSALELLKVNKMAGDRIQEIVKNLRNFARLDESDLKTVDLHEGLDSTLMLLEPSLRGKIDIVREYGSLPEVACFPGLLNQVFMNLLVNAVHAIDGKGTITVKTYFDPQTDLVNVAITDTGKGIAPENLPRIFDPGFTTKGVGVGTGLGLALCFKIMDKHDGGIAVDSIVGQGTTMTVYFKAKSGP